MQGETPPGRVDRPAPFDIRSIAHQPLSRRPPPKMPVSQKEINSARKRLIQMHFESGVGHVGGNLSCLDAIMVLYHDYITPKDRFILSKGHSAGALYTALWSIGR